MFTDFTLIELGLLVLNIVLFLASKKLFNFLYQDSPEEAKPRVKSAFILTGVLLILQGLHIVLTLNIYTFNENIIDIVLKTAYTIGVFYIALIMQSLAHYILKQKYGETETVDGKDVPVDTHASRMWSVIITIVTIFGTIYLNIQIWSAASLMETTGLVGLTLGALALTNGVWFPDIHRGLIALKVKSFSVGDVIKLDNREDEYIVGATSLFHLNLLNIRDNHRMFLWNHQLNATGIHNLSKVAGSLGLRKTFTYKIGYPKQVQSVNIDDKPENSDKNENQILIEEFIEKVRKMTADAYQLCLKNELHIKEKDFEIRVLEAGDYAIEFVMSYYIERLPKTVLTNKIREYLIDTPLKINEAMLVMSYKHGLDLSTPTVYTKVPTE